MNVPERAPDPVPRADLPLRLGPDRIVLLPVVVAFLGGIPAAFSSPALTWILLLPVLAGVWVVRARVVARADVLEVCNGLTVRRVDWPQVGGFDVPRRGFVRLRVLPGTGRDRLPLTALARRDLPRLLKAVGPAR